MRKRCAILALGVTLFVVPTIRSQSSPGPNDAELKGDYAFSFSGFTGTGGGSAVFAAVGMFTADGAGNLTNGELDTNGVGAGSALTALPFTGTYSIGADHRGVMNLNIPGGARLAFAMTARGSAQFIEFDAAGASGTIGSGSIEKADPTSFSTARITGDYAFGLAGFDASSRRVAFAGRVTADGAGHLANGAGDINAGGLVGVATFAASNYTISDTAHGRGTATLDISFSGSAYALHFVFYAVNSGKLFAMETDALTGSTPLLNGPVLQQQTPTGGFSSASLNGGTVLSLTGRGICTSGSAAAPDVVAGLLTGNGNGGLSVTYDENCGLNVTSDASLSGTYTVAANGRVSITLGPLAEIAYLVAPNQIFFLDTGSTALFGPGDAQAGGPFTNSAVKGGYAGVTTTAATFGVTVFSGEFAADGASPTGHLTGTVDIGSAAGSVSGAPFSADYSISPSPTDGRGTATVVSPTTTNAVTYVISPQKLVVLPVSVPNPSLWLFEQAPASTPPPSVTLSSLKLNPSSVTGGTQSATGTVTLSGPAPSGGAQVTLSSSNTTVARVPSSVTVSAGATTANFTVATSAVTISTTVTITASYAGMSRSASLTVTPPPPPPPPTLNSLTLNPSSVIGGPLIGSSTGTVRLSGPAPSGGAQVALSSSNPGVASVPGSVTIPAGANSASFTINTSVVLFSTKVTISASYRGVTNQANLAVNAVLPLGL